VKGARKEGELTKVVPSRNASDETLVGGEDFGVIKRGKGGKRGGATLYQSQKNIPEITRAREETTFHGGSEEKKRTPAQKHRHTASRSYRSVHEATPSPRKEKKSMKNLKIIPKRDSMHRKSKKYRLQTGRTC